MPPASFRLPTCLLAVSLLAACAGDKAPPIVLPADGETPAPVAYERHEETDALWLDINVTAAATAIPELGARLVGEAEVEARDYKERAERLRAENPDAFRQRALRITWTPALGNARWLSLGGAVERAEGGPHPMHEVDSVLWDKDDGRGLAITDLFADPRRGGAALTALSDAAFAAWAAQSPAVQAAGDLVDERTLDDARRTLAPMASSFEAFVLVPNRQGDGRAAGIELLYPPNTLGPDAEGVYRLFIPADVLAPHLRPEYADRFGGAAPERVES